MSELLIHNVYEVLAKLYTKNSSLLDLRNAVEFVGFKPLVAQLTYSKLLEISMSYILY